MYVFRSVFNRQLEKINRFQEKTKNIKEKIVNKIKQMIHKEFPNINVIFQGSYKTGLETIDSDIDIQL